MHLTVLRDYWYTITGLNTYVIHNSNSNRSKIGSIKKKQVFNQLHKCDMRIL